MRRLLLLALAFGSGAAAVDLAEPALIRIDAVATDVRGRVVENLGAEDFEILEDGVPRPVESVRFVPAAGPHAPLDGAAAITSRADEHAAAVQDGARIVAIFLDEYHVTPGAAANRARDTLGRLVAEALGPRDLALVVKPLDSLLNLRLTRDRDALLRTIVTFEGRKGLYEPRNAFEQDLIAGTPQRIEAVRTQVAISALNALAAHLAGLGTPRKSIVLVSEGFARSPRRRGDEALPSLETAIRTANRASVSIYPFDPGDASAATPAARDTLRALAEQTEGRAILDIADPLASLTHVVSDANAYYLIAFRPAESHADGRFHPVDVRVRRPNTTIAARKGYWAPSADDVLRAKLLERANEPKAPPEPRRHISPLIRPWFGLSRGSGGATQVSFVWEPSSRVPGDRSRPVTLARITLKASRPDGTAVFEGVVRPSGGAAGEAATGDEPARAVFEAMPGRLRLQMQIEDVTSQIVDTDVRDLVVNPLNAPVTLGTAEIIRARSARDVRALASSASAVPTPAREFSRSERLLIRVPAYAPADGPVVSARLLSKPGVAMRELSIVEGPASHLYQIDLPLAGLASGSYVVQFSARSPVGEAKDEIAFRVTP